MNLGLAFAVFGAILFSTKSVVIKLAYAHPVTPEALLTLRLLFALPVYLVVALRAGKDAPSLSRGDWGKVIFFGLMGYYVASIFDFWGLADISAGLERLILYTYPLFVILLAAAVFGRKVTTRDALAFGVAYLGVALVVLDDRAKLGAGPHFWRGVIMVLLAAGSYALYLVGSQHIIPRLGAIRYTALAMPAAAAGALIHFLLVDSAARLFEQPAPVYGYALFLAVFSTILPTFLISAGLARIGAARTAMVGAIGPIVTMLLAWPLLGEPITAVQILGSGLAIYGVAIANGER